MKRIWYCDSGNYFSLMIRFRMQWKLEEKQEHKRQCVKRIHQFFLQLQKHSDAPYQIVPPLPQVGPTYHSLQSETPQVLLSGASGYKTNLHLLCFQESVAYEVMFDKHIDLLMNKRNWHTRENNALCNKSNLLVKRPSFKLWHLFELLQL